MTYAYIFDFDGVLVDTMEAHFSCYQQALAEVNVPINKPQFFRQAGMTGIEQIRHFADKAGVTVDAEKVYARKREIWPDHAHRIGPIASNLELLRTLKNAGHPVAIASGSSRPSVLPIVEHYEVKVDAIVTAEDITRGKPSPDLFLRAAEALNVGPENCVVIEDSEVGLQAARAAGMKVMIFSDNRSC